MKALYCKLLLLLALALLPRHAIAQPCPGDLDGDGQVTVDEILTVVNAALVGCTQQTPTPVGPSPSPTRTPTTSRTPTRTSTATPTSRFIDNADGTISDVVTGLMWEKKSDDDSVHDQDLFFSLSLDSNGQADGTAFTTFLALLNSNRFAGYHDWRLPTLDELKTIVDRNAPSQPVVPDAFNQHCVPGCHVTQCSCTAPINYWTLTEASVQTAWYVLFNTGDSATAFKTLEFHTRGVRGGS